MPSQPIEFAASRATATFWGLVAAGLAGLFVFLLATQPWSWGFLTPLAFAGATGALAWRWATHRIRFEMDRLVIGRLAGPPHVVPYGRLDRVRFCRIQHGGSAKAADLASRLEATRLNVPFETVRPGTVPGKGTYVLVLEPRDAPAVAFNLKLLRRARHVREIHDVLAARVPHAMAAPAVAA